jgi:hypothetical protein
MSISFTSLHVQATQCSSSGESTVSIHRLVYITLCRWLACRSRGTGMPVSHLLTYSMQQSPSSEANWFCSQSRNSPHYWNLKVHYHTHKCPLPVPILSLLHPVATTPSHFLKIHLNILPSTSGSPQWSPSLRQSPTQSGIYQMMYWYNWFSWWWALGCAKYIEKWNK